MKNTEYSRLQVIATKISVKESLNGKLYLHCIALWKLTKKEKKLEHFNISFSSLLCYLMPQKCSNLDKQEKYITF